MTENRPSEKAIMKKGNLLMIKRNQVSSVAEEERYKVQTFSLVDRNSN